MLLKMLTNDFRALKIAHHRLQAVARARVAPHGLTPSGVELLLAVQRAPHPTTQAALRRVLGLSSASVSRTVQRLERLGLVARVPAPDRRAKDVRLTAEGALRVRHAIRALDGAPHLDLAPLPLPS